ncbi:MAG: TIGR01459 family HAD-type hydrolase [Parvularculaceae bacterium]|nr:TIGR01459 family HAD-type hydrolase [Parvularculaceae bacterium]
MQPPVFIAGLAEIADRYDALLCDAWGVIHDGERLFAGVAEALTEFRRTRGPVLVLTNAPRPSSIIPGQLDRLGLPRAAYDGVVTSGDATRAAIEAMLPARAFKLGPEKDDGLYEGLSIEFAPMDDAGFIICTGLFDDQRETPDDYVGLLAEAARRNLPMICANPDIVVRWGGRLVYCAGALAQIYDRLGARVVYGGKPHSPIYDLALARLRVAAGRDIAKARTLAIGDGLATDIGGANAQGIDALYVTGEGGVHDGASDERAVITALAKAGAHAAYAIGGLQWR